MSVDLFQPDLFPAMPESEIKEGGSPPVLRESDIWSTPPDSALDRVLHFNLDACALPENAKCARYFTPEDDALKERLDWRCLV
jgi:DNA N-6-adenine-methyltransferase (Dam)